MTAAVLFGASTPFSKLLLARIDPVTLAGLMYLGAGVGLLGWRAAAAGLRRGVPREPSLGRRDLPWLAGAVVTGGVAAPILLLAGLRELPAATASLLLSLEGAFTAVLAWGFFGEHLGRRVAAGVLSITAGGFVLAWAPGGGPPAAGGAVFVAAACLAWAVDNNLTRRVAAGDPLQVAGVKGLAAGAVSLVLGRWAGGELPGPGAAAAAGAVGLVTYGVSLAFFVLALRHLGAARTVGYFSVAPFVGAGLSLLLPGEGVTAALLAGGALTAWGVWLHLTERHPHEHKHTPDVHEHSHRHGEHHRHPHPQGSTGERVHAHPHAHTRLLHRHPHYPDLHHRHRHR
ncbi:MAG: EamA family transporter [Deferrisomatales bacterium]